MHRALPSEAGESRRSPDRRVLSFRPPGPPPCGTAGLGGMAFSRASSKRSRRTQGAAWQRPSVPKSRCAAPRPTVLTYCPLLRCFDERTFCTRPVSCAREAFGFRLPGSDTRRPGPGKPPLVASPGDILDRYISRSSARKETRPRSGRCPRASRWPRWRTSGRPLPGTSLSAALAPGRSRGCQKT